MAKDTNTSKCQGTVSGCSRRVSSIHSDKFRTNDGFMFKISVVHDGPELSCHQISNIASCCARLIHRMIDLYSLDDSDQLEFDFIDVD